MENLVRPERALVGRWVRDPPRLGLWFPGGRGPFRSLPSPSEVSDAAPPHPAPLNYSKTVENGSGSGEGHEDEVEVKETCGLVVCLGNSPRSLR